MLHKVSKKQENRKISFGFSEYMQVYLFIYLFWSVCLFRAAPVSYGGSQARGPIRAVATGLRAASATYTTAHGNAGSLTTGSLTH